MIRRLVRLACVAVAATGITVVGVLATPAHAESSGVRDKLGDVIAYNYTERTTALVEPGDGDGAADITRAALSHGAERITVKIHVRDLGAVMGPVYAAMARLRLSDGTTYLVLRDDDEDGTVRGALRQWYGPRTNWGPVLPCDVAFRRSQVRDVYTWAFDRECLGSPEWVRFGAVTHDTSGSSSTPGALVDDARRGTEFRSKAPGFDADIGGPRLYAGPPVETPTP